VNLKRVDIRLSEETISKVKELEKSEYKKFPDIIRELIDIGLKVKLDKNISTVDEKILLLLYRSLSLQYEISQGEFDVNKSSFKDWNEFVKYVDKMAKARLDRFKEKESFES